MDTAGIALGCGVISDIGHGLATAGKAVAHAAETVGHGIVTGFDWTLHHVVDPVAHLLDTVATDFTEVVLREEIRIEDATSEIWGKIATALLIIRAIIQSGKAVALDTGAAYGLCYAADLAIPADIAARIGFRVMLMPQTANDEFMPTVQHIMKPGELALALELLKVLIVIPDNPSARVMALRETKSIGRGDKALKDKKIFGTADKLGIVIFTDDAKFVRAAEGQGVRLDAQITPGVRLGKA